MTWIAGIDGCRNKWFAALREIETGACRFRLFGSLQEILRCEENPQVLAIDIPIILCDGTLSRSRRCDEIARSLLGGRRSSIFTPPVLQALHETDYGAARKTNLQVTAACGMAASISRQAFALLPKIREVNGLDEEVLRERVREIHPELSFMEMNGGVPMRHGKKSHPGMLERLNLLRKHGFEDVVSLEMFPPQVPTDDVLDACAACWTAERIFRGTAVPVPGYDELPKEPPGGHGQVARIWR